MKDPDFIKLLKKNGYEIRSNKDLEAILNTLNEVYDFAWAAGTRHNEHRLLTQ